jgi:hypothetical protein
MVAMNPASHLRDCTFDLVVAARSFQAAAQASGSYEAVPQSVAALEDALQALSGAWYQPAAHASPGSPSGNANAVRMLRRGRALVECLASRRCG